MGNHGVAPCRLFARTSQIETHQDGARDHSNSLQITMMRAPNRVTPLHRPTSLHQYPILLDSQCPTPTQSQSPIPPSVSSPRTRKPNLRVPAPSPPQHPGYYFGTPATNPREDRSTAVCASTPRTNPTPGPTGGHSLPGAPLGIPLGIPLAIETPPREKLLFPWLQPFLAFFKVTVAPGHHQNTASWAANPGQFSHKPAPSERPPAPPPRDGPSTHRSNGS